MAISFQQGTACHAIQAVSPVVEQQQRIALPAHQEHISSLRIHHVCHAI
jgi:hypothetical protein